MLIKRSGAKSSKIQKDKGSLILLWITITICFTLGFIFAYWCTWGFNEYMIYGSGLLFVFIVRWASILQLKKAFTVDVAIGTDQKLKTDGMYKTIRHPSYLELLLIMIGFSISMNSLLSVVLVTISMFLALIYRISVEETVLVEAFGEQYIEFKKKTKKLIPWIM